MGKKLTKKFSINPIFFDTDCISAFLWVQNESILVKLYPSRIVIPKPVYDEISYPGVQHLKNRIDTLLSNKQAFIEVISVKSESFALYQQLTLSPKKNHRIIGKGEAAAIVLAKEVNGIVGSNNLKDVSVYIKKFNLKHLTTGDILLEALKRGILTENHGNIIWNSMLKKKRRLGWSSFSDFIKFKKKQS
jgi:predicted nucleic acid-binding protein